jgi:hypothetical protein
LLETNFGRLLPVCCPEPTPIGGDFRRRRQPRAESLERRLIARRSASLSLERGRGGLGVNGLGRAALFVRRTA